VKTVKTLLNRILHKTSRHLCPAPTRRLSLERLEERDLLALFLVVNGNSSGSGSLAAAVAAANDKDLHLGHDTILIQDSSYNFNHEITLSSALTITDGVTIFTESEGTVFIHCEGYSGQGLVVNISGSEPNRSHSVSFTDLQVANAEGDAFRLGGATLVSATLTDCCAWGTRPNYNAGAGILIESCNANNITLTDCDILRRKTGIAIAASAHVTTLNIEGAQILASNCAPSPANWVGIKCEGTGKVLIQDHIEPVNGIPTVVRESRIHDIPGTAIYLNGQGSTNLQAEITGIEIGTVGPISGNGIVVENWRGTVNPDDGLHNSYLVNNTIANCGGSAVRIANSFSFSLALNAIHDNVGDGVAINSDGEDESSDILLFDNTIQYNDGNGVAIVSTDYADSSGVRLFDNTIASNGGDGILLSATSYGSLGNIVVGDDTFSTFNTIQYNAGHGISIVATGAGDISGVDVINNYIASSTLGSIAVDDDNCSHHVSNAYFFANCFVDGSSPINLGEHSNHELAAPVIDLDEVRLHEDNGNWYWVVPYSINAGTAFGNQEFEFQLYRINPVTHEYECLDAVTDDLTSDGSWSGSFLLPTTSYFEDDCFVILASCVETGDQFHDTSEFSNVATLQDTPPRVVGVSVGNAVGRSEIFAATTSPTEPRTVPAVNSDAQLQTVRVCDVRTVSITFSRDDVVTDATALTVVSRDGLTTIHAVPTDIIWSGDHRTATWTLDSNLPTRDTWSNSLGEWYIVLNAADVDTPANTLLDGDWVSPECFGDTTGNSVFPSGNGTAGGNFEFAFTVLPGDTDRDGDVDLTDLTHFGNGWNGTTKTWATGDFDGDEDVDLTDLATFSTGWYLFNHDLPNFGFWRQSQGEGMLMAGEFLESESLSSLVDEVFQRYGFGDGDPTNDMALDDARWDALAEDLFDVLGLELAA
jgi:hypothetical protein